MRRNVYEKTSNRYKHVVRQLRSTKEKLEDAGVEFETVDADENMEFCRNYGVRGLPTALFFEDGELVKSLVGNNPVKEYIW